MTHQQMLHRLGIKDEEFRDYLRKLCFFLDSLDATQREFHYKHSATKTVEQFAEALGSNATSMDVERLFAECPPVDGICIIGCC
jgi:hypothetical protein